jgi:prevent-host-death family protein
VSTFPEITERDLSDRLDEIMDAVQNGQSFIITRGGRPVAELVPLPRQVSSAV